MSREFVIYADESVKKGKFCSNFYGGALIDSKDLTFVTKVLTQCKVNQNLKNEVKWTRVTSNYLSKYTALMDCFFDLIASHKIKIRVMFTQNSNVPINLSPYQREHSYHLLYYQFFKHAFGIQFSNYGTTPVTLRLYIDKMPDTKEKNEQFKSHLSSLEKSRSFRRAKIKVPKDQIAEVDSKKHVILQCLDVVLGSMAFRLNNLHKVKPAGSRTRSKRTIAKEALYKHIYGKITTIHPSFNIGVSTGTSKKEERWLHPYRHWLFIPNSYASDDSLTKKGTKKAP